MKRLITVMVAIAASFWVARSGSAQLTESRELAYGAILGIKAGIITGATEFKKNISKRSPQVMRGVASE